MGKCKKNTYRSNDIVILSRPLVCYGGFGQPQCEHFEGCLKDNGYMIVIMKSGRRRVKKIKEK